MTRLLAALLVGTIACASQPVLAQDKASAKKEASKAEAKSAASKDDDKKKAGKQAEEKKPAKRKKLGGCG